MDKCPCGKDAAIKRDLKKKQIIYKCRHCDGICPFFVLKIEKKK